MSDITMCSRAGCSMRMECYRCIAEKNERQTYFEEPPVDGADNCKYFLAMCSGACKKKSSKNERLNQLGACQ